MCFGWVDVDGHFLCVVGGQWTFFMGGWGGWTFFMGRWGWVEVYFRWVGVGGSE